MLDLILRSTWWWYSDPFRVAFETSYLLTTSLAAEKYWFARLVCLCLFCNSTSLSSWPCFSTIDISSCRCSLSSSASKTNLCGYRNWAISLVIDGRRSWYGSPLTFVKSLNKLISSRDWRKVMNYSGSKSSPSATLNERTYSKVMELLSAFDIISWRLGS